MTLIASFAAQRIPVLVGDVVVSRPLDGERVFYSPAAGSVEMTPIVAGADAPVTLCQKLVTISENLWFAWAGPLWGAKEIALELSDKFGDGLAEGSDVTRVIQNLKYKLAQETSVLGICRGNEAIQTFAVRCKEMQHPDWGVVRVAGSGFQFFRSQIEGAQQLKGPTDPVGLAFALAGSQMCTEIFKALTLRNGFGGYCEIAYWAGERLTKLEDVTYLFWRMWQAEKRGTINFRLHPVVLKATYHGNILIIRRIENVTFETEPEQESIQTMIAVPSISELSDAGAISVDPSPLNSGWRVHTFLNQDESRVKDLLTVVVAEAGKGSVRFIEEESSVRIFGSDHFRSSLELVGRHFLSVSSA